MAAADDSAGMVRSRSIIALGAFAATLTVAAAGLIGSGDSNGTAPPPVPILASGPTISTAVTAAPTTVTLPPTTLTTITTSTTPTTVARKTVPPPTAAPRPPTTPAPPKVTVTTAPRAAAVASTPTQASPGNPSDYTLIGYRWNPCQAVTVSSSGPDVAGAVAELVSITGLQIQMVPSGGQITVAWGATPIGGEVGQTDWRSVGPWMVSANIVLNNVLGLVYLPTLIRHELAHALGLGHAARSNEIMYGNVGLGSPTTYQAGDLAGLRAVGASAGC